MSEAASVPETVIAPAAPPGAQLAAARESNGLSITDIARQLKLSPWQVEALEAGDYRRLPGAVFVRGFIRNYARVVKLDAALLLSHTEQGPQQAASGGPPKVPSADIPFPTGREINWHKYAIAAIVVVVPLVIFEFYLDDTPDSTAGSRQVESPKPQAMAQPEQATNAPPDVTPSDAPAMSAAEPGGEPAARGSTGTSGPAAANTQVATNEQRVRLRFAQDSWVEIRDRDGRRIFSQFNQAGTEQVVSGVPPLSLVVGNAKGVDLIYNEQPVDLGPHTKVDVARLTLD